MKKYLKHLIKKYSNIKLINFIFFQRKYQLIGFNLVFINMLFQRVFRINSEAKWQINFTSRVAHPQQIKIYNVQDNASVFLSFASSGSCYIQANNGIEIHKNVTWAYGVHFISANHSFKDYLTHKKSEPIKLMRNVWIGAHSVILPGVEIGEYSIIGAGSIVTKSKPPFSISAGNPSRILAYRCKSCLDKLEKKENLYICLSCSIKYNLKEYE
jgi:acetyltransferase-like isoleucine patch superfamily enzyme